MRLTRVRGLAIRATAFAALILFASCDKASPTAPPPTPSPTCTFQASMPGDPVPSTGATVTVNITTTTGCAWRVQPAVEWITVTSGSTGSGSGTATLAVAENAAPSTREGVVMVEGQTLRLTQHGRTPCTYSITPQADRFGPDGGPRTFRISTGSGCTWTVVSSDPWVSVEPSSGSGDAEIRYVVAAYTGTTERVATIHVNDLDFTVRQDRFVPDCSYSVSPTDFSLHWHGQQSMEARVSTAAGCRWTVRSSVDWLTVAGPDMREGSDGVLFSAGNYTQDGTRRAPLEIRWDTPTAGQNVWISQDGCRYGMTDSRTVPATGEAGFVTVVTQAVTPSCALPCPWTATSDVLWIRITSSMPRAGDDAYRYVVDPNPGPGPRTGRITVADRVLVITQQ